MNKYVILIILCAPLALYGLFNVFLSYKLKKLRPRHALIRMIFWTAVLAVILFIKPISDYLYNNNLTDTPPLSIFDVLLATGIMLSFILIARLYSRISELENKFTDIHERLSIVLSKKDIS